MSNQLQVSGEAKIRAIQGPVVANSGVITALDGDASEYVRGDGTLADFPTSTGGGSSVSYYLNTSVSQGTIGGVAYKQLSKTPISGAGTDITTSANGYIASYITDANDPALLEVPAGNFNCEFYFSVNSNSHNPYVYAEVYKYDGTTFTLLGSNVAIPQYLTNGTTLSAYYFAIPVATSVLTVTDRISIRIYVNVDGRTVTLHTENNHLCQVVTTFSKGLISLNNLTRQNQFFATGTSGTDFAISSATATHTFNLPVASAANTGKLSSTDWSTFNGKVPYTGATADVDLGIYGLSANLVAPKQIILKKDTILGGAISIETGSGFAWGGSNDTILLASGASNTLSLRSIVSSVLRTAILDFSTITASATRTFTLPDASGTIALTSNLSAYLPLTGGTLTGVLNGTTAAFSDSGTSTNTNLISLLQPNLTASSGPILTLGKAIAINNAASIQFYYTSSGSSSNSLLLALYGSTGLTIYGNGNGSIAGSFTIGSTLSNGTYTYTLPSATGTLALLSGTQTFTGATTFSSDITVNGVRVGKGLASMFGNTALGVSSLNANTTGNSNTALGYFTLSQNTTGFSNVAIGFNSMVSSNGNENTAIGNQSMQLNTTGVSNTAIGHTALQSNTTGNNNIAIGYESGINITTGSNNTIIGKYAGTAGMSNNIVLADGAGTIRYQWNGTNNVFTGAATFNLGSGEMRLNRTGTSEYLKLNTYYLLTDGNDQLLGSITGSVSIYAGSAVSPKMTITSGGNVGIGTTTPGNYKLYVANGTSSNKAVKIDIGYGTGSADFGGLEISRSNTNLVGDGSSLIFSALNSSNAEVEYGAYGCTIESNSAGNQSGRLQFMTSYGGTTRIPRMTITSGGIVDIAGPLVIRGVLPADQTDAAVIDHNSNTMRIFSYGASGVTGDFQFRTAAGGAGSNLVSTINGTTGVYVAVSNINRKKDFEESTIGLNEILSLKPTLYRMKDDNELANKELGFIAQEVKEFIPYAYVETGEDDNKFIGLNYNPIVAALVKAMQEQQAQIEELKALINK